MGDIFSTRSGLSYKKAVLNTKSDKMIRILRGGNIADEKIIFKDDDISIASEYVKSELYLKRNYLITPSVSSLEHIGKIALIDKDYSNVVVGGFVLMLSPHYNNRILSEYFLYALASKYHRDNCRAITHKSGQAFYNISRDKMMNLFIPLPPLAEQERIVAKLEELLPLVERYGDKQKFLDKLKNDFPVLLKKSILQEAVQGRLVPQDLSDEPASVLLERIREEKQRLIKEGKIKKDKNESIIYRRDNSHYEKLNGIERCIDDEIPFEIPESWEWVRFVSVINLQSGQDLTPDMYNDNSKGIPYITGASNIEDGKVIINRWTDNGRAFAYAGDLLLTCKGTVGLMAVLEKDKVHIARQIMAIQPIIDIAIEYVKLTIETMVGDLKSGARSMIPGITRGDVLQRLIPLPPLAEQYRIVKRVEELQDLIKEL